LVRALPCHGRGRGFESRRSRFSAVSSRTGGFAVITPAAKPALGRCRRSLSSASCKDPLVADDPQQRLAGNEAVFRQVNEAIESGKTPPEAGARIAFRCECAELGCNDLIELTVAEYEQVRSDPRRFLVTLGHDHPDIETIIETHPGYAVVEKRDAAAEAAKRTDPRSSPNARGNGGR
jgi:hypothetical protein